MVLLENGCRPQCSARLMSAAFIITKITVVHRKLPMDRKNLLHNDSQVVIIFDTMLVMSLRRTTLKLSF